MAKSYILHLTSSWPCKSDCRFVKQVVICCKTSNSLTVLQLVSLCKSLWCKVLWFFCTNCTARSAMPHVQNWLLTRPPFETCKGNWETNPSTVRDFWGRSTGSFWNVYLWSAMLDEPWNQCLLSTCRHPELSKFWSHKILPDQKSVSCLFLLWFHVWLPQCRSQHSAGNQKSQ